MSKTLNNMDLFNNPMVNNARKNLSQKQIEDYKIKGEQMYGNINFENSTIPTDNTNISVNNNLPVEMIEATMYILDSIRSGLHPSMLKTNEKELLKESYGEKWYEKYGYNELDLNDIVTIDNLTLYK